MEARLAAPGLGDQQAGRRCCCRNPEKQREVDDRQDLAAQVMQAEHLR